MITLIGILILIISAFVSLNILFFKKYIRYQKVLRSRFTFLLSSLLNTISFAVFVIVICGEIVCKGISFKNISLGLMASILFLFLTIFQVFLFDLLLRNKVKARDNVGVAVWGALIFLILICPISFYSYKFVINLLIKFSTGLDNNACGGWGWIMFPVFFAMPLMIPVNYYFLRRFVSSKKD